MTTGRPVGETIRLEQGREKLIVMPFVPAEGCEFDGRGLGLHFLAGNLICLHRGLLECWFGWRVKKIFPHAQGLLDYCLGKGRQMDIRALGEREKVRFWLEGEYAGEQEGGTLDLVLHDTRDGLRFDSRLPYSHGDGLAGFRRVFFDWLEETGLGCDGRELGGWPENISAGGLESLGQAIRALYIGYVSEGEGTPPMDLGDFRAAVAESPSSYLTQDLLGWGLYKNGDMAGAVNAFEAALALNPDGMGAHAGRMWIALASEDRRTALHHALEKGRCRGEDPEKARTFVAKKLG